MEAVTQVSFDTALLSSSNTGIQYQLWVGIVRLTDAVHRKGFLMSESNLPPIIDKPDEAVAQSNPPARVPGNGMSADVSASELPFAGETAKEGEEEWEEEEVVDESNASKDGAPVRRVRRRKRQMRSDAAELKLLGRRELCKRIGDIASNMLKTVKLRVLSSHLESMRGMEDDDLTQVMRTDADKLADRSRILAALKTSDPDFNRGQLKAIIFNILLQEETYSIDETRLEEKVIDFEKALVKRSRTLDFAEVKKQDPDRWHHLDTYRIVLEAAWNNDETISPDEARLLSVLRAHLGISLEEHWLIHAWLKRFPKEKCALHTPDEINEARKELQRDGLLWSYRDETNRNIDVIPAEIAVVIRKDYANQELQRTNYRRLLSQDSITLAEVRSVLQERGLDRYGNKAELIERIVVSDVKPSDALGDLDREKLSGMCASFGLKAYAAKSELIERLIAFYDDLTFEERITKDDREVWYSNYELIASRSYAELRAKKIITKDLNIEHFFEAATVFLFQARLSVPCEYRQKDNRADGRLPLESGDLILWDCKSVEGLVNLQDHLDGQFDGYLRKEKESGKQPLAFLVIGPGFTPQSIKLAHQYKARTNWDIALVTAEGLKHLADRWFATAPNKPFPVRLLNRTEVIDKERAEFLLSLA